MVQLADPVPWGRSTADTALQESLVADGVLPPNTDPSRPVWIAPTSAEREPQPPSGYVVSLGFSVPTGRFIRALCHHYKVELHNFSPNSISQAAVFVAICEGYLGVEAHWELWKHLFRGELYTKRAQQGPRRAARIGGLTLQVRERRGACTSPCKMTTNNAGWSRGWFYLRNDGERLPAYTGKVLRDKLDVWGFGVSPVERQAKLGVFTDALRHLARQGLTAAVVIANFHRQRVLSLMERRLAIYQLIYEAARRGLVNVEEAALPRCRCLEGEERGGALPLRCHRALCD